MKVRIPFVVNPDGKWCAYGYPTDGDPDWDMCMEMADNGDAEYNYQRGFIEVDLPVPPKEITVQGTHSPAETSEVKGKA
jgi:hypothetical protein